MRKYFFCVLRLKGRSKRKLQRSTKDVRSLRGVFEQLEDRQLLSASTVSFESFGGIDANIAALVSGQNPKLGFDLAALARSNSTGQLNNLTANSLLQLHEDAVAIQAVAAESVTALAADLVAIGTTELLLYEQIVTGFVPFTSISALATLDSLSFATPLFAGMSGVGNADTQGHVAQRTSVLRDFQGLNGAGIRVGVISDSFDNGGAGAAATDIGTGDLPGTGNPNGFLTPINVVRDNDPGIDEGRAMLQIVHDVAPAAQLSFANVANAFGQKSQLGMADNIRSLAADDDPADPAADIIVDDWWFFAEPFFMDGFVAQAVDEVVAQGVTYFAIAHNYANDSYDVASFVNSGQTLSVNVGGGVTIVDALHNFGGGDVWQQATIPPGLTTFSFQWDDPFRTVAPNSTGATRDYNIWIRDFGQTNVLRAGSFGSTLGGDPVEVVQVNNTSGGNQIIEIALGWNASVQGVNDAGRLKYVMFSPDAAGTIGEFATNSPTLFGHANAEGTVAVGAAFYGNTPEFGTAVPALETFSGLGSVNV